MKQKTKNKWLNLGNQDAAYFHKVVKKGNAKNFIKFCMIQMGIKWRTRINLKLQLWSFISTCWVCQRSALLKSISIESTKFWGIKSLMLRRRFYRMIWQNWRSSELYFLRLGTNHLVQMDLQPTLLKKAWSIVKDDVIKAIPSFFELSRLLWEINDTIITLVPKVTNSSIIGEFRPISCYNVTYKCHTKIPG